MNANVERSKKEFSERIKKRTFVRELKKVSMSLALWAQNRMFENDWSIEDIKDHIKAAMTVCGRD